MASWLSNEADPTLALPRILCLHGGGTNAQIFRSQCRGFVHQLKDHFRLVFPDAPFICNAGPDVTLVYSDHGPFRRWLRWLPQHPEVDADVATAAIEKCLEDAIREDDAKGATGEFVALIGFSQGGKLGASLLLRQQREKGSGSTPKSTYRFGVLIAGRGPLVTLDPTVPTTPWLADAGDLSLMGVPEGGNHGDEDHVIRMPTIHVHGLQDEGLKAHRKLLEVYCDKETRVLIEWDGGHRVPFRTPDVKMITDQIFLAARKTGVIED